MIIYNERNRQKLAVRCEAADSFLKRFKGLMGKKALPPECGLLLVPCNSIHMFFMRFAIDAVFLDKNSKVVHIEENLMPWRLSKFISSARCVLELPSGTVSATGTRPGDTLIMQ